MGGGRVGPKPLQRKDLGRFPVFEKIKNPRQIDARASRRIEVR